MDSEQLETKMLAVVQKALELRRDAEQEAREKANDHGRAERRRQNAQAFAERLRSLEELPIEIEEARQERAERNEQAERQYEYDRRASVWRNFLSYRGAEYEHCTLDTFECSRPAQSDAVAICQRYIDELPAKFADGEGLTFYGPCGVGKDHLAVAVCRAAILQWGKQATWISGTKLFNGLKDTFNKRSKVTIADFRQQFARAELLCISDPILAMDRTIDPRTGESSLVYGLSPTDANVLNEIADERCNHHRPTLFTINAKGHGAAATLLPEQVIDRWRKTNIDVTCWWPSYREEHRPQLVAAE